MKKNEYNYMLKLKVYKQLVTYSLYDPPVSESLMKIKQNTLISERILKND